MIEVPDTEVPDPECREYVITFADGSRQVWSGVTMFDAMDQAQSCLGKCAIKASRHTRQPVSVPIGA